MGPWFALGAVIMERRADYRHYLRYRLTLKCPRTSRIIDDLVTEDVSASGLSLVADNPHDLVRGDRLGIRLHAQISGTASVDTLVMATDGQVIRVAGLSAALSFRAPLAY